MGKKERNALQMEHGMRGFVNWDNCEFTLSYL